MTMTMTREESLAINMREVLYLSEPAIDWLLMLWHTLQVFDDFADDDTVQRGELDSAIYNTLVAMPNNQFFLEHSRTLLPCLSVMILKWQGADKVERSNAADAKSYMWRAGYYDLILMAMQLCHGAAYAAANAHLVMQLYGEKYEDYIKEFAPCQTQLAD